MARKSISFSLGAFFVWSLISSAWGYCGPQKVEPDIDLTQQEMQLVQGNEVKEAHHPCHSLKDPYVVSGLRDFLQPVSSQSLLQDIHPPQNFLTHRNLPYASGPSPPPINAPPLESQPLFLLNQSLLI